MQEFLLTTEQVAEYLRVDKFTVYRLVTQREIPAFKVGNQWRFKQALLDEWLLRNSNMRRGAKKSNPYASRQREQRVMFGNTRKKP